MDVLFVHAYPFDARLWSEQVAAAPPDVRCRAFDLPGFGANTALAADMDDFGEAIHQASAGLGRFVLCGLSLGGYAAFAYWRRHGREGRLAGLVLADTRADPDTAEGRAARDSSAALARDLGLSVLAERLLPHLLSPGASGEVRARVRAMIESQRPEAVVAALHAMRDRPDSRPLLGSIDVPVLGLAGELDLFSPPEVVERLIASVPRGRFEAIPRAGHLANLEQPGIFLDAVVRFVRSLPKGAGI